MEAMFFARGSLRRLSAASSAASVKDIAELFLLLVLNWNRGLGATLERVSCSFSDRALIAYRNQERNFE